MERPSWWKKLASHFREEVLETQDSSVSGQLEVWLAYGRYELNTASVNYSFGTLDTVFREALGQLRQVLPKSGKVLILGLGAGNVVRILSEYGRYTITGVELDPVVIQLGEKYFGLGEWQNLKIWMADAVEFVRQAKEKWNLVIVDLFVDSQVPKAAEQPEFLQKLPELLETGGILLFNRLMHTEPLAQETERFTQAAQKIIPGLRYLKAHKNRMLVYEKG